MKLVVRSGERRAAVTVERDGETACTVTVGEGEGARVYRIDAADLGAGVSSLLLGGTQREVAVHPAPGAAPGRGGRYKVGLSAVAPRREVEVLDPLTELAGSGRGGGAGGGRQKVTAMMPGRVVALLAAEGDAVETGQGVLVLEAMKMENEIAAEHPGTVVQLHVEAGQTVEAGEPLFEIG